MKCRHCQTELQTLFLDLGYAPPSNAYLTLHSLTLPEKHYPLRVWVCESCWLVQTEDYNDADELFAADYAYFSSFSSTWLAHAQDYVAKMTARFSLNEASQVIEVAANDGYLLQYVKNKGIPCLGIEPTHSTAEAARAKGIEVIEDFFGVNLAQLLVVQGKSADLMAANNVLAHVPDINDFVKGFALLLKPSGVATFEFPHLLRLVEDTQFDTVYHEHFSYLSLTAIRHIFAENGLIVFDVEQLTTHGGSLRVFAQTTEGERPVEQRVADVLELETAAGMNDVNFYQNFQAKANKVKNDLLLFLLNAQREGKKVAGYGAAAKGNTLLNYAGVRPDLLPYVVDLNPAKQHKFLPASHIPIVDELKLQDTKPDYVLILPWNLRDEIMNQLSYIRDWGGQFVTAVPELSIS